MQSESESVSHSVMSNSLPPHGLQPARHLCPWNFPSKSYWSGLLFPPPGDRPYPRIEPRSPSLQADSSPSEPPGKPNKCVVTVIVIPLIRTSRPLPTYPDQQKKNRWLRWIKCLVIVAISTTQLIWISQGKTIYSLKESVWCLGSNIQLCSIAPTAVLWSL